jgi:hypothetical protein
MEKSRGDGKMRLARILMFTGILFFFWGGSQMEAGPRRSGAPGDPELQQLREQVGTLQEDISAINLLNALHLSREQMSQILQLAQEARMARENTINSPAFKDSLSQAQAAFNSLRTEIQKGAPARGEIPARAAQIKHRLKDLRDQAHQQLGAQYQGLENKLRGVLSPEQLKVVQDFKPCLIPPRDLRNPVRAGQAASREGAIKHLRRLRQLPEDRWQARKQEIVQRMVNNYSRNHYRLSEAEKQREQARLLNLAAQVRRMSPVDFEMEKEKLAAAFKPQDRMQDLRREVERRVPHGRQAHFSRVGRFLLSERIIPILEERLQHHSLAAGR